VGECDWTLAAEKYISGHEVLQMALQLKNITVWQVSCFATKATAIVRSSAAD
jgi:hypothetical protein